jgi:hypothetical protein
MAELRDLVAAELAAIFGEIMRGTAEEREIRLQQLGLTTNPEYLGPASYNFNLYNDGELVGRDANLDVQGPGARGLVDSGGGKMGITVPDMTTYVQHEGIDLPPWQIFNFTNAVSFPTENPEEGRLDIPMTGVGSMQMMFDGNGLTLPISEGWLICPYQKTLNTLYVITDAPEDFQFTIARTSFDFFPGAWETLLTSTTGGGQKAAFGLGIIQYVVDPATGLLTIQFIPYVLNPADVVSFQVIAPTSAVTKALLVLT